MDQFIFRSKYKNLLFAFMALGLICMALTWFNDDALHTRFWTNFLHNSMFFTGIGFAALFLMCMGILTYASWFVVFKRIWEAYSLFMVVGLGLMLIIVAGVWGHFHHLYHWADIEEVAKDVILRGKSSFLNPTWYSLGTIIVLGSWIYFAIRMRALSIEQDTNGGINDLTQYNKMKVASAIFLPIAGFSSAAMIWQWIMSLDAHWYSTMFAWYATASWVVSMFCVSILTIIFLKSQGFAKFITIEHLHDLGKMVFAFSIFWTYLWFSQFMLIWYANNGEETIYFNQRMMHYPVLFWGNLIVNFVLPFLIFIRNDTKRKYGSLVFVSLLVLFGHWWDFFLMIKPGTLHTAQEALEKMGVGAAHGAEAAGHAAEHASTYTAGFTLPGLLEIGTMLGFLALFFFVTLSQMAKVSLRPKNDPFLPESLHHHVQ